MTQDNNKFMKGALILSFAGIIAKIISAFYRIPLAIIVGDIGLGYYDTVYPIYTFLVAAALVGIPNAVSKLIAEDIVLHQYVKAKQTFKYSMYLVIALGAIASILLFVLFFIMNGLGIWEDGYIYIISGIAIAPIFVSITGVIRGYFQGMGMMKPTAITQIVENIVKVIVGLSLVMIFKNMNFGLHGVVSGALIGAAAGVMATTFFMGLVFLKNKGHLSHQPDQDVNDKGIVDVKFFVKTIVGLAVPVTLVSAAYSVMRGVDSFTVVSTLLSIGKTADFGTEIIGQMGKTYTIINVPLTISVAISASIVPAISRANAHNNFEDIRLKTNQGVKFALLIALPAATGIFVLAEPIIHLLYRTGTGYQGYIYMRYFAICLVMMILSQTFASILQGLTKQYLPLISLLVATVVKVVLNVVLLLRGYNGHGVAIASIGFYLVFMFINYRFIKKSVDYKFDGYNLFVKPFIASLAMGVVIIGLMYTLPTGSLSTLLEIVIGGAVYVIMLFVVKGVTKDELVFLGEDNKVIKMLEKYRLL